MKPTAALVLVPVLMWVLLLTWCSGSIADVSRSCRAHRLCPEGMMCGTQGSCVICRGCSPNMDTQNSFNGLCPARCSRAHQMQRHEYKKTKRPSFHWVQYVFLRRFID
jgi:hypothetical protein